MHMRVRYLFFIILFTSIFLRCYHGTYSYAYESKKQKSVCVFDDGYIYRFGDSEINIVEINDCSDMKVKNIVLEEILSDCNIYVSGNNLFLSGMKSEGDESFLIISIYDICDKQNPVKTNEFQVRSDYYISKNRDSFIYLAAYEGEKSNIICLDLSENRVHLKTQEFYSEKPSLIYTSSDDLYIICGDDVADREFTTIYKFHANKDILTYVDKVSLDGEVLSEKFIDEYLDNLRIFALSGSEGSKMYVFDEDLKLINCVDKLFNVESVSNVYFDENMFYISGFSKKGYFISYNLDDLTEVSKIELPVCINHIYGLDENRIIIVGNETRFNTYKNLYTDKVYELMKNIGLKILLLEDVKTSDMKISSYYLIKGKYVYSSSFLDESQLIYLKDEESLVLPIDISDYSTEVDMGSAMEVSYSFYENLISNFKKIFNGIYILNFSKHNGIDLNSTINNYKNFNSTEPEEVYYTHVYDGNIFMFTSNQVKAFDLEGMFLGVATF